MCDRHSDFIHMPILIICHNFSTAEIIWTLPCTDKEVEETNILLADHLLFILTFTIFMRHHHPMLAGQIQLFILYEHLYLSEVCPKVWI